MDELIIAAKIAALFWTYSLAICIDDIYDIIVSVCKDESIRLTVAEKLISIVFIFVITAPYWPYRIHVEKVMDEE